MSTELTFNKKGAEIKAAIAKRINSLQERLNKRNEGLELLLKQPNRVRSYLLRNTQSNFSHGYNNQSPLFGKEHISSEEVEEINQMCRRIMEVESEITRLKIVVEHLDNDQSFSLSFGDLVSYGFNID